MLPAFALRRPATLEEALELIDDDAVPYWGGTELLLAMKLGLYRPDALVDLKRIPELTGIAVTDDGLVIRAGVTHAEIASSPLVAEHAPLLAVATRTVGNARVRAQGTIGGNLCFAEPRSDIATVLTALDARVRLRSTNGARELRLPDFVLGAFYADRAPDEILVEVLVPLSAPAGVYRKYATVERPTVVVALVQRADGGYRAVVGAVAEVPFVVDAATLDEVDAAAIAATIDPIADLTGQDDYKRHVTQVYVERAVAALREAADD
jgi:aerobic carbon-monoxide dehydrogenase medium subunit